MTTRQIRFVQPLGAVVTLTRTDEYLERTAASRWLNCEERVFLPFGALERIMAEWEAYERRIGSKEIE